MMKGVVWAEWILREVVRGKYVARLLLREQPVPGRIQAEKCKQDPAQRARRVPRGLYSRERRDARAGWRVAIRLHPGALVICQNAAPALVRKEQITLCVRLSARVISELPENIFIAKRLEEGAGATARVLKIPELCRVDGVVTIPLLPMMRQKSALCATFWCLCGISPTGFLW